MITKQNSLSKLLLIFLSILMIITNIPLNVYATEKTNPTSKSEKDTVLGDRADNGGQGSSSTDKYIDADDNWQPVPEIQDTEVRYSIQSHFLTFNIIR